MEYLDSGKTFADGLSAMPPGPREVEKAADAYEAEERPVKDRRELKGVSRSEESPCGEGDYPTPACYDSHVDQKCGKP